MKLSEEARQAVWQLSEQPESVCYIEKHDGDGLYVEEIDGDYCHVCAEKKAKELDMEDGGKYYHQVYEEISPEAEYFKCCQECGCLLDASLIVNEYAEDSIQIVVDYLHGIKTFADINGHLAWRIEQLFGCNEEETYQLFPKQMNYIVRRLNNLYKKQSKQLKHQGENHEEGRTIQ